MGNASSGPKILFYDVCYTHANLVGSDVEILRWYLRTYQFKCIQGRRLNSGLEMPSQIEVPARRSSESCMFINKELKKSGQKYW